jgi:predicted amidohydrolase YtcJ
MRSFLTSLCTSTPMTGTPLGRIQKPWKSRAFCSPGKEAEGVGVIVRDENGLATGELRETAMGLVSDLIPEPSEARKRELLKMTIKKINATGVTSVHNMNGDMEELMVYAALEDAGEMTLRVYVPYHIKPETTEEMSNEAAEMAKVKGNSHAAARQNSSWMASGNHTRPSMWSRMPMTPKPTPMAFTRSNISPAWQSCATKWACRSSSIAVEMVQ